MTSTKRRITLAVILAVLIAGGSVLVSLARIQRWNELGWAAMAYLQADLPEGGVWGRKPAALLMVFPNGPADRAGLREGDVLLTIGGIEAKDVAALRTLDARISSGDVVEYEVRRGDATETFRVRFESPLANSSMFLTAVVNGFVALTFIAIGLLVFTRKPDDRRSVVFYAMTLAGALSLFAGLIMGLDGSNARGILTEPNTNLIILAVAAAMTFAFVPLTLHLSLVFPKDRPILVRRPYILGWIYGTPIAAVTLMILSISAIVAISGLQAGPGNRSLGVIIRAVPGAYAVFSLVLALVVIRRNRGQKVRTVFVERPAVSIITILGILMGLATIAIALRWGIAAVILTGLTSVVPFVAVALFPLFTCISLYRSYREAGPEERRQVTWPLWGILIALGLKIVLTVINYAITTWIMASGGQFRAWTPYMQMSQLVPTIGYLLIPISFAVAIFKYRLMNIDVIIKKTVVYAILSGAIIILYLILVGGLGTLLVAATGVQNQTMVIAATLIVAAVFVPLRNRLQHLVERNLFRQKIDYPQALRAITTDAVTASEGRTFLTSASEKLQQALQNRAVVIFQRRDEMMIATAKVGVADSILGSAAISTSTAGAFDRPLDPRRRPIPDHDAATLRRLETTLVVPVRSQGSVAALIALSPKLSDQEFDLEDIEFISSAADQMAFGIDRIRVRYDEADFEQARQLQQGLMPAQAPEVTGIDVAGVWQPARTVGGDYYDFLRLTDTQLALCIGDVAGKGMPAALLMSALQAAVRASADPDVAPSRVVERVRRVIVPSLAGRFVTFFYCTFDTPTGRLRYCNAGHNPPVVVHADGSTIRLSGGGPILSRLFRDAPLQDGEVELHSGDRLVLFTDGVSEARDAGENDFGEERLEALIGANRQLSAKDLAAAVVAAVASFAGGHPEDDLTLVTMGVN